ncbi:hypothetical protein F2Q70_00037764 [Brassica cretica]|uniref:Disease resistance R13L4/SHOC-2-like LRR domain-containing protein n=1 Tax=Brassica cretica TaxID=69181 RepID=A0A8S9JV81_BRACR|nr:hypothetical protein F2Q70_00037764 [Brassica cretica]
MSNLQFLRLGLEIDGGGDAFHLYGGQSYLSRKLRLLEWRFFPMSCLNCIPNPELLVELSMHDSKLEKLWEGTKPLTNLKWVDLRYSKNLKDVSSLSTATSLEELNLTGCSSLVELPSSIGNAIHLKKLDLSGCSSLVELPSSIGNAIGNLEHLDFSDCSSLVRVPSSIGHATNLQHLDFSRCSSLLELPASIGNLHKLYSLFLSGCRKLEVLPVNINLKSLRTLDLTGCSIMKSFPEISTNIEDMYLTQTAIKEVPSSISLWPRLDELHMSYSENLKEFPQVLDTMTVLVMSNTEIQEISPWIKRISHLRRLVLKGCKKLLSLPQLPSSLSMINAEDCESLERLDCSFLNQKISLNFAKCFKLNKEARDVIIKSSTNYITILPGKEMPNYFNYQANGGSLVMKLNERPSSSSMTCKACILLVSKDEDEAGIGKTVYVHHGIKQNSLDVPCSPSYHTLFRPLTCPRRALSVQQACSKAVAAMARYGIDPATAEDKKRNVIHSLCKPLSDSLLDSQHLALGASLCLKSLVDCDSWRFASSEMVNTLCQSLAVSLEAASESHMALVIALAKRNAFTVEAYARLFVKSGLRILELGVVEGDAQKRVLAVQMLNFLMKYLNPKIMSSEVELVLQEMGKHVDDEVYFVRVAVHETLGTAERLIREVDQVFNGVEDDNMETVCFHQRSRSSEFNESFCSMSNQSRRSRRNRKKRRSERSRHGFRQDSFTELLENREQLRQYSESSSSSSIHDRSGTTTPTEDVCEKLKSEDKVKTEETVTRSKKSVLRWGLSFFSVVVAGFASSFMWVHLRDDMMMMPPHLVPT